MNPPSDPVYQLEVSRADLAPALKIVARAIGKRPGDVSLHFEDGSLTIDAGITAADVPACGEWPVPIFVGVSWVCRLARRLPIGDPIDLRVDAGKLYANRYSEPCALTTRELAAPTEPPMIEEDDLIDKAARILKPLRIRRSDVQGLIYEAQAKGSASWSMKEKRMASIIAKACVLLAPLGVETSDVRRLVDEVVRNAWKRTGEK